MTVDELIAALQKLSADGHGSKPVFSNDGSCGAPGICHGMEPVTGLTVVDEEPKWEPLRGGGSQLIGQHVHRVEIDVTA